MDTLQPTTKPSRQGFADAMEAAHAAIRRERRPLPAHDLNGVNYRRWAVAVCNAEVAHAKDDFWRIVGKQGAGWMFDRDGINDPSAVYRFSHEVHAGAALTWLLSLQTCESRLRGVWASADAQERQDLRAKRRELWAGFVRQVERYRDARRALPAPIAMQEAA